MECIVFNGIRACLDGFWFKAESPFQRARNQNEKHAGAFNENERSAGNSKIGVSTDSVFYPFNLPINFGVIYKKLPPPPLEYNASRRLSTKSTLQHIAAADYDMLLLHGDLSYADYIRTRWDSYGWLV
jgi:hypothetical protein